MECPLCFHLAEFVYWLSWFRDVLSDFEPPKLILGMVLADHTPNYSIGKNMSRYVFRQVVLSVRSQIADYGANARVFRRIMSSFIFPWPTHLLRGSSVPECRLLSVNHVRFRNLLESPKLIIGPQSLPLLISVIRWRIPFYAL